MGSLPIGLSGSRAAAILGMSPWSTPFQTWQQIMEARTPGFNAARKYDFEQFEGNASTRWGLAFEDAVIRLAEEKVRTGIGAREAEFCSQEEGMDYVTCHIDGMYHDTDILHEGKTTSSFGFSDKWGEPGGDKIPVEYQLQVQHQMLCTGADTAIVSVLVFPKRPDEWEEMGLRVDHIVNTNNSDGYEIVTEHPDGDLEFYADPLDWARTLDQMGYFHQYTIVANPELQALMLEKYREWWTEHVIGETPPEPQTYDDIRAMITEPVGTIIVDPGTARWFKEYKDIGGEIGAAGDMAKRRDQLKVLILSRANNLALGICPHNRKLTYNTCHAECGKSKCAIGTQVPVLDDESVDKWVFRDGKGNKVGSYAKNKKGTMTFR